MGHEDKQRQGKAWWQPSLGKVQAVAHPPCLHVQPSAISGKCLSINWAQESCKEECRDAQRQGGDPAGLVPSYHEQPHAVTLHKIFASCGMCRMWLLLWISVVSHKSTISFCTLWKVWKAVMCCFLFLIPTLADVLHTATAQHKTQAVLCVTRKINLPCIVGTVCKPLFQGSMS